MTSVGSSSCCRAMVASVVVVVVVENDIKEKERVYRNI